MASTKKSLSGVLNFLVESSQHLISRININDSSVFTNLEDPSYRAAVSNLSESGFEIIRKSELRRPHL